MLDAVMADVKRQEYELLNEIAKDSMVTQAKLSMRLGMAVGSVNWYIKRLIKRGYVKVFHLDRTRLQYDLTPEGMSVFTERAVQYAKDSLKVYKELRQMAKGVVEELKENGVSRVYLEADDEQMDIFRLTCIEASILVCDNPCEASIKFNGNKYQTTFTTIDLLDKKTSRRNPKIMKAG